MRNLHITISEAFNKLGLLMSDINREYTKYHPMIVFIIAKYVRKNFSCSSQSSSLPRHAKSVYHKIRIQNELSSTNDKLLFNDDDHLLIKESYTLYKGKFQCKWLDIEEFKYWLRQDPNDDHLYYCLICNEFFDAYLSHIYFHANSRTHLDICKSRIY